MNRFDASLKTTGDQMRRFVIVGTRAMSKGKLPLNDLGGGAGRMDVLIRALMAALLTSHGIRKNVEVILILGGGPGPSRRIKFVGSQLIGLHAEERSIAGQIAAVIRQPMPPRGHWVSRNPGIFDGGGDLEMTLKEWNHPIIRLDAEAPSLFAGEIPNQEQSHSDEIGFIIGDDKALDTARGIPRSLGKEWLQGNACITIVHYLLDQGIPIQL